MRFVQKYCSVLVPVFAVLVLLSGCQPCCPKAVRPTDELQAHFYFVQITDTHWGQDEHFRRTEQIIKRINALPMKVEFVVFTGDNFMDNILDDKVASRAMALTDRLSVPAYFLPGNHDILTSKTKLESTLKAYKEKCGPLAYRFECHGVSLLFVYTEPLFIRKDIGGYDTLAWLENALKQAGDRPSIVFHHRPSVGDFCGDKTHPAWPRVSKERWHCLLNSHNVKAVIAGHSHRAEQYWVGDVPLYISGPVAAYWGRQATFRIYEYRNGKVSYRTEYVN